MEYSPYSLPPQRKAITVSQSSFDSGNKIYGNFAILATLPAATAFPTIYWDFWWRLSEIFRILGALPSFKCDSCLGTGTSFLWRKNLTKQSSTCRTWEFGTCHKNRSRPAWYPAILPVELHAAAQLNRPGLANVRANSFVLVRRTMYHHLHIHLPNDSLFMT